MTCKKTLYKVAAMWSLTTMVGLILSFLKLKHIHVTIRYCSNVTCFPCQL